MPDKMSKAMTEERKWLHIQIIPLFLDANNSLG